MKLVKNLTSSRVLLRGGGEGASEKQGRAPFRQERRELPQPYSETAADNPPVFPFGNLAHLYTKGPRSRLRSSLHRNNQRFVKILTSSKVLLRTGGKQIIRIYVVETEIFKRNIHMYFPQKKQEDTNPPAALTLRTWDVGGGTPALTSRTWDMGGETPAVNLLGSTLLYAKLREKSTEKNNF